MHVLRRSVEGGLIFALCVICLSVCFFPWRTHAAGRNYHHVVILSDIHVPSKNIGAKEKVIRTIDTWDDVELVAVTGDVCAETGTLEEYAEVKRFFSQLAKPVCAVPGNHDFIYKDIQRLWGNRKETNPALLDVKLERFRETFGMPSLYFSKKLGDYLLVFLSPECDEHLAEMSEKQVEWLDEELEKNRGTPTIIFFHAPLEGTLWDGKARFNNPDFIAQPAGRIRDVLMRNPQVLLWVSGHTHTSPEEESFDSPVNLYEGRIVNIHNTDLHRETIWTNSLFLYGDRVVVKTYNHKTNEWVPNFERTIPLPPVGENASGLPPASLPHAKRFSMERISPNHGRDALVFRLAGPASSPRSVCNQGH